ncbi:DUF1461 domain-containing protein [Candidatus Woesearchaeota archaeon]|nr:DUF1461 domain-containing protein [Candidatus Woesearchaeota archaeon]
MKFLTIAKFLLVLILPFLLFLLVLNFVGFDSSFYSQKFSEYNVGNISPLHEKVISFIEGKINELPGDFNEREKQHLLDVRNAATISTIVLYILVFLFILLLIASILTLKVNNLITNFIGKILVFGGVLTIALAAILFFLINSDFSSTFESFHSLFFKKGTYVFDPAKEIIVRLYPEQLFMDLGIKISKGVVLMSAIAILLGSFLVFKSKSKKNKNK